jgi:hypothetical protein
MQGHAAGGPGRETVRHIAAAEVAEKRPLFRAGDAMNDSFAVPPGGDREDAIHAG